MIRVLIADDQHLVRAGFRSILEQADGIDVVGEAADGREAIRCVDELRPDLVLMDLRMPNVDGLAATKEIMRQPNPPRVVMLTTFDADEYVYAALRAGATGFLLKDISPERLIDSVRASLTGESLLSPVITRRLVEAFVRAPAPTSTGVPAAFSSLSQRELEVLLGIARGLSNAEIAGELFLAETTVKTHVVHILAKIGARDRVQAVVAAYDHGLVRPG